MNDILLLDRLVRPDLSRPNTSGVFSIEIKYYERPIAHF